MRAVGVATLNAFFRIKKRINAKADWQYLGVDKFTRWLEWNYERAVRFTSNLDDTFAYGSYSSKDIGILNMPMLLVPAENNKTFSLFMSILHRKF